MTKDEALDLALEALENGKRVRNAEGGTKYQPDLEDKTITAIKQALAAQQEHEPENEPFVSLASVQEPVQATMKLESSGPGHGPAPNQKLSVRHVSLIDAGKTAAQPAPVQEPVAWREFDGEGGYTYFAYQDNETWRDEYIERNGEKYANWVEPLYTASSTSHLHLLSDEFIYKVVRSSQPHLDDDCADWRRHFAECKYWLEIARGITPPPAQTAVPDAMTSADIEEHIEYVAGWNDCRQAMMEMMK
jgi:hypothetical protein